MSYNPSRITVSIAQTQTEINQALEFCGSVYERTYGTHWTVPPDLFFMAKEDGEVMATGGLTFAALHPQIASERYFRLSTGMQQFIESNRQRICEFGRFASLRVQAAKAILHSALHYCTMSGIDFLFAWANPTVYKYTTERLGLHFWPIPVPLDLESAMSDSRWASPPVGFFQRIYPPALHLGVVPFWENAKKALAEDGLMLTEPEWQKSINVAVPAVTMKSTSFAQGNPRLLRAHTDVHPKPNGNGLPNFSVLSDPGVQVLWEPTKPD